MLFTVKVTIRELIGRMKSNLYSFVDGHIYYNNNVIKVRYDIIDLHEKDGRPISEDQLFDFYSNVLPLDEGVVIQSGSPF